MVDEEDEEGSMKLNTFVWCWAMLEYDSIKMDGRCCECSGNYDPLEADWSTDN